MTPLLLDIGTGELVALVVLAAVLLGPEKVPGLARKAARIWRFLRGVANTATDQIKAELGPEFADLTAADMKPKNLARRLLPTDVQSEMTALRGELSRMQTEMALLKSQTDGAVRQAVEPATHPALPATAPADPGAPPSLAAPVTDGRPESLAPEPSDTALVPVPAQPPAGDDTSSSPPCPANSANAASDSLAEVASSSSTAKPF